MAWLDGSPMARLAFYLWKKPSFANWSTNRRLQLHLFRGEEHVIHQNDRALRLSLSLFDSFPVRLSILFFDLAFGLIAFFIIDRS